jgi:hypothetical protein
VRRGAKAVEPGTPRAHAVLSDAEFAASWRPSANLPRPRRFRALLFGLVLLVRLFAIAEVGVVRQRLDSRCGRPRDGPCAPFPCPLSQLLAAAEERRPAQREVERLDAVRRDDPTAPSRHSWRASAFWPGSAAHRQAYLTTPVYQRLRRPLLYPAEVQARGPF